MTKILVIEDEKSIRSIIHDLLSIENFEVIEAKDGQEGLKLAFTAIPDLIICDIMMPKLDGYKVLIQLQNNPKTQIIPFLFLTARGTRDDIRRGMGLGADDYLIKPFTARELVEAVNTRLKKRAFLLNLQTHQNSPVQTDNHISPYYDTLTHLPNQFLLREQFNKLIVLAQKSENFKSIQKSDSVVPLLVIKLDRFKRINEQFGYELGDSLLKEIADRFQKNISPKYTLARLNGSKFALILTPINDKLEATKIAQVLLNAFSQPFFVREREIFSTLSIGIVFYPDDGNQLETLLQKAQKAMERIQHLGGNQYLHYTSDIQLESAHTLSLETDLRYALERQEFEVYYQPQISLKKGKVVGAEALVRWLHPQKGFISPNIFIPLAEATGLIEPIGFWIVKTVCQQIKAWQNSKLSSLRIAVNLSGRQFYHPSLHRGLEQLLQEIEIPASSLELELTERTLIDNATQSIEKLNYLKQLGFKIAVDDFGTGYSSLGYLQQFPFDILKIDRCFIQQIHLNPKNSAITKAIISMAHQLNLKVIAEGVETQKELTFLRQNYCDEIQGYLFSPPVPIDIFENLIKTEKRL